MFDKSSTWSKYPLGDIDISGNNNMRNFIDNYYNNIVYRLIHLFYNF